MAGSTINTYSFHNWPNTVCNRTSLVVLLQKLSILLLLFSQYSNLTLIFSHVDVVKFAWQ